MKAILVKRRGNFFVKAVLVEKRGNGYIRAPRSFSLDAAQYLQCAGILNVFCLTKYFKMALKLDRKILDDNFREFFGTWPVVFLPLNFFF